MRLSAKVLVVGGGPSGSIAARTLAENGVDVVLLEKNLSFIKPCGGGIPYSAFDELTIPKLTIKKEVKSIRIVSPTGERVDINLKSGSLAIIQRGDFDAALRRQAEQKGAKVIQGEFTEIINDKRYYKIQANIDDRKSEIVTGYIIAADGINSRVRNALKIKPSRTIFTVSEHIKEIQTEICEFWFASSHAPNFYSWVFPSLDGISTGTGCPDPRKVNDLFEIFKKRKSINQEGQKRVYRIPIWQGNLYNKGNILFAGDSAGQVLPLAYEGIYNAMKAGEFAARAILEGKADNYKKLWKARFQKRFILMDKLGNYFLKDDASIEKLVSLHKSPDIQEASERLWLSKETSKQSLLNYIKLFGKFLH
jgi:geranylgeranyl diphosphate/geranylgeranyl-bacteriochlorophyllide a reductase